MTDLTPEIIAIVDANVRRDAARAQKHGGTWRGHRSRSGHGDEQHAPAPADIVCVGCGRLAWHPAGGERCVGCQTFGPPSEAASDRSVHPPLQGDPGSPRRADAEEPPDHTSMAATAAPISATVGPAAPRRSRGGAR